MLDELVSLVTADCQLITGQTRIEHGVVSNQLGHQFLVVGIETLMSHIVFQTDDLRPGKLDSAGQNIEVDEHNVSLRVMFHFNRVFANPDEIRIMVASW